jgi:hypothetical protein
MRKSVGTVMMTMRKMMRRSHRDSMSRTPMTQLRPSHRQRLLPSHWLQVVWNPAGGRMMRSQSQTVRQAMILLVARHRGRLIVRRKRRLKRAMTKIGSEAVQIGGVRRPRIEPAASRHTTAGIPIVIRFSSSFQSMPFRMCLAP